MQETFLRAWKNLPGFEGRSSVRTWLYRIATNAVGAAQPAELAVLRRYMAAVVRADLQAAAELLADDVRTAMPPCRMWLAGRDAVLAALRTSWDPASPAYTGRFRLVPTAANGRPAVAGCLRAPGRRRFPPEAIAVVQVEYDRIVEMTAFHDPRLFRAFGLPAVHR